MSSESESNDEFFDAEDITPKSRGHSLRKKENPALKPNPKIKVSLVRPESLSLDLEDEEPGSLRRKEPIIPRHHAQVLPDEITRELESLSHVDKERTSRIAKLEKWRKGVEDVLPVEAEVDEIEEQASKVKNNVLPESAESSVEGIYISGARVSHPFKVYEPEPDRRSVCSVSSSVHGRSSTTKSVQYEPNSRGDSVPKFVDVQHRDEVRTLPNAALNWHHVGHPIPDIVSSVNQVETPMSSNSLAGNSNSLAENPARIVAAIAEVRPPLRPPRRTKSTSRRSASNTPTELESPVTDAAPKRQEVKHLFSSPVFSTSTPTPRPYFTIEPIPSPASTVASLTRELEDTLQTLDLHTAMQGQYVVKPQDDERSKGDTSQLHHLHHELQRSLVTASSIEEEPEDPVAPLKNPKDDIADCPQGATGKFTSDRKSIKSVGTGGSGGRRSSSSLAPANANSGPVSSNSLGSNFASAASGSSSGGKRSLHSGGSMDSSARRDSSLNSQMNMFLRTRSDSGKKLNDEDILRQIKVKNLDTGEEMDLVEAEDQLPPSINPLSLHIMRLTSEYVSGDRSNVRHPDSDTESMVSSVSGYTIGGKKKRKSVKKFFGSMARKTSDAAKSLAVEASKKKNPKDVSAEKQLPIVFEKDVEKLGRLATEIKSSEGVPEPSRDGKGQIFKRIQAHKSGPFDFEGIKFAQELSSPHLGPIWCMKFSQCGQLLATAGQDTTLRIWVLKNSFNYFNDMRNRYNADSAKSNSPTNSYENVISDLTDASEADKSHQVFMGRPFCQYQGHTSDLLDVSWSKNYFILTSSMDKTVRLWHISRRECLCCFQHIDFVTAICFHPRNDQFFLSGSLDGKLRLWNIPDKKVALWNEVEGSAKLITTANFIQNGKFAVVGTYDGRCIFYSTDHLKYHTTIHVRSSRGKNAQGRKVTGIEPMPGEDKVNSANTCKDL